MINKNTKESFSEEEANIAKSLHVFEVQDIYGYSFIRDKIHMLPYVFAKEHNILPLEEKDEKIIIATSDPLNLTALDEVRLFIDKPIEMVFCRKEKLLKAIEICYQQKVGETKLLFSNEKEKKTNQKISAIEDYDLLERSHETPAIQMLNALVLEAIQQRASDIHFDPQEEGLRIRYRIDGILFDRFFASEEHQPQIITRIKVMARLDIAEQRLPQEGRIKLKLGKREIDFRVSTIPVVYGERIALRILDRSNILFGLNKIGMPSQLLEKFKRLIHYPEGIVLVTGPTGSGKTTTLYSVIAELNAIEKNIMTIEDPVEYKLLNIAQIGVNTKIDITFAKGLRHILRQDPDIIMIGEIRDKETSEIAIQSSLTGHLVFSTLHTNDACSALIRLTDMGVEPYLLSSSIIGVLAQRLVRKICPSCRYSYKISDSEKKAINGMEPYNFKGIFYSGKGCRDCFNTGYKGRQGIYELLEVTNNIKKQIMKRIDIEKITAVAKQEDMLDLFAQGLPLVCDGITTYSELLRVTRT